MMFKAKAVKQKNVLQPLLAEIRKKSNQFRAVPKIKLSESQRELLLGYYNKNREKFAQRLKIQKGIYDRRQGKKTTPQEHAQCLQADIAVLEIRVLESLLKVKNPVAPFNIAEEVARLKKQMLR